MGKLLPWGMKEITVGDKRFRLYLSSAQIQAEIERLAAEINRDYAGKRPLMVPILNGAFLFAADLLRSLKVSPEVQFMRVSTYGDSMHSSRSARVLLDLDTDVVDRHILLVEDIVDSGYTSGYLQALLQTRRPASVRLVSLLFKPESLEAGPPPDYVGFKIPPDFVVGYGLDYAQMGRELPEIYSLA